MTPNIVLTRLLPHAKTMAHSMAVAVKALPLLTAIANYFCRLLATGSDSNLSIKMATVLIMEVAFPRSRPTGKCCHVIKLLHLYNQSFVLYFYVLLNCLKIP